MCNGAKEKEQEKKGRRREDEEVCNGGKEKEQEKKGRQHSRGDTRGARRSINVSMLPPTAGGFKADPRGAGGAMPRRSHRA